MSEMPETIWAQVTIRNPNCGTYAVAPAMDVGNVCYRRADLPPTLSAAMELPEVRALVDRIEELNAACDAMWNDQGRVVKCDNIIMGTPYAIKEKHMRAISEAQQRLFTALAAIKEPKT